jgi:H+/gluconate symporter-like permease
MKWNGNEGFWERVMRSAIIAFIIALFLGAGTGFGQVLGSSTTEATKSFFGQKYLDWFDNQLMLENVKLWTAIVGLVVVFLVGAMIVYRMQHVESAIEKKVEDEANEIKAFNASVVQRLLEAISDQQKKDIFQTIAQGQAALWKPEK